MLGSSSGRDVGSVSGVVGSVSGVVDSGGVGTSSSSSDVASPGGVFGSSPGGCGAEVGGAGGSWLGGVLVSPWGGGLDIVLAGVVALGADGRLVGLGCVVGAALVAVVCVEPGVVLVVWGAVTEFCAPSSAASLQPSAHANTAQDATKR